MFNQKARKNSSKSNLNSAQLPQLFVTLDEQKEESLSGGADKKTEKKSGGSGLINPIFIWL
jgi:hypothetical protein